MHTLSIFPSLLTFGLLAPFLIRLAVSMYLLHIGKNRFAGAYKWTSIFYFLSSALVFVGLFTQIAVLLGIAVLKFDFFLNYWKNRKTIPVSKEMYSLYILSQAILISLLFTGPGFLAFDLPL